MATRWHRDPIVVGLTLAGALAMAVVVFAGRYLPYQDWAGHVGLSAVLSYGDVTGADRYLTRSFVPTPYFIFYSSTAGLGRLVPIEVAAKLNLVLATVVASIGAARLAQATGRSPRLSGIAPLLMFGAPLGFGFASFVIGLPWLLHALADAEQVFSSSSDRRTPALRLTVFLALCFLGHGLVFVFAAVLIGVRSIIHLFRRREPWPIAYVVMSGAAVVCTVAMPSILRRVEQRYVSPEFMSQTGPAIAGWADARAHLDTLAGDLLDRGGTGHGWTMAMVIAWGAALVLARYRLGRQPPAHGADGLTTYAWTTTAVFALGPVWLGWPVTFWIVYQRAGTLAALLWLLSPRTALTGRAGVALAIAALIPVAHNAFVNRSVVRNYSDWAAPYDDVRAEIPRGARVLPLNRGVARKPGDTLGFYLLVDGASYIPIGNIPEEMPVHRRNSPGTPYNPTWDSFVPSIHGRMYDYVVVYGTHPRMTGGSHRAVARHGPWTVFRTVAPHPPSEVRW